MYQKIIIIGNLGRDPEMRYLPNGKAVTNLNVASNRVFNDSQGQKVTETTWFRVTAWGAMGENCNQYLTKGRLVYIEGRLNPDPVTGGPKIFTNDGGKAGASYEVTADLVKFLSGRSEAQTAAGGFSDGVDEDPIPF